MYERKKTLIWTILQHIWTILQHIWTILELKQGQNKVYKALKWHFRAVEMVHFYHIYRIEFIKFFDKFEECPY